MPKIFVPKAFKAILDGGELSFKEGAQDVSEAHAAHWWVKAHSTPVLAAVAAPAGADNAAETPDEIAKDEVLAEQGVTKESLLAQANELGIETDGRWGLARLQAAIDAHQAV